MLLENNVDMALVGEISLEDESIKWLYDGLGCIACDVDEHLDDILETDTETINDFLTDNNLNDYFYIGQPEINNTIFNFRDPDSK